MLLRFFLNRQLLLLEMQAKSILKQLNALLSYGLIMMEGFRITEVTWFLSERMT